MTRDDGAASGVDPSVSADGVSLISRISGIFSLLVNEELEQAAFEALAPFPGERFLLTNPGCGHVLRQILAVQGIERVTVVGAEPWRSHLAADQNRSALKAGLLTLLDRATLDVGGYERAFDAVLSVHDVRHWPIVSAELLELRGFLRPAGRLLLVWSLKTAADQAFLPTLLQILGEAGFSAIHHKLCQIRPFPCLVVEARRNG